MIFKAFTCLEYVVAIKWLNGTTEVVGDISSCILCLVIIEPIANYATSNFPTSRF